MATRSTIALEFADGTVGQVYCHWDGYLDHNGKILQGYYTDPFKLRDLIDLGDVSSLGLHIGGKHDFDTVHQPGTPEYEAYMHAKHEACTFYGRDRNESGTNARYFNDFEDYKANHQYEEYEYILRKDGHWYVSEYSGEYKLLAEELVKAENYVYVAE